QFQGQKFVRFGVGVVGQGNADVLRQTSPWGKSERFAGVRVVLCGRRAFGENGNIDRGIRAGRFRNGNRQNYGSLVFVRIGCFHIKRKGRKLRKRTNGKHSKQKRKVHFFHNDII